MVDARPTIGVIAGMGPRAGVAALDAIFRAAREDGVRDNHRFPRVLLHSVPARSQVFSSDHAAETIDELRREAGMLARDGATLFLLACVTMHKDIARIRGDAPGVWISLVDEGVDALVRDGHRRVAVLATETTDHEEIYRAPLAAAGITVVDLTDDERRRLNQLIDTLIGGPIGADDVAWLAQTCDALGDRGATAVVFGCTDLAAVYPQTAAVSRLAIYDALTLGARAAWRSVAGSTLLES